MRCNILPDILQEMVVLASGGENVVYTGAVAADEGVVASEAAGRLDSGEEEGEERED